MTWIEFNSKVSAVGVKKMWIEALLSDLSNGNESDKKKNGEAYLVLLMHTMGTANEYVMMHDGNAYKAYKELKEDFHDLELSDLQTLYKKYNKKVNEGPGKKNPKLFSTTSNAWCMIFFLN